jgi:hypothetical protein
MGGKRCRLGPRELTGMLWYGDEDEGMQAWSGKARSWAGSRCLALATVVTADSTGFGCEALVNGDEVGCAVAVCAQGKRMAKNIGGWDGTTATVLARARVASEGGKLLLDVATRGDTVTVVPWPYARQGGAVRATEVETLLARGGEGGTAQ